MQPIDSFVRILPISGLSSMSSASQSSSIEMVGTNAPPGLLEAEWLDGCVDCIRLRGSCLHAVDDGPPPHQLEPNGPSQPSVAA